MVESNEESTQRSEGSAVLPVLEDNAIYFTTSENQCCYSLVL